ncbi:MAG: type II secretion system minor pseudopilin GspI [Chromatiales bacterium]|nr:type II secretion system minor pseudopilin GspI [Chromatiales bacterium]
MHSNYPRKRHRRQGFTLIEVLISVVVLAIALGASLDGLANYSSAQAYLQERYMAHLVAWNTLISLHNNRNSGNQCENSGSSEGYEEQAGVRWRWLQSVEVISDISDGTVIDQTDISSPPLFSVEVYAPNADPDTTRAIAELSIISC